MTERAVATWDDGALRLEEQLVALAAHGLAGSVRELTPGPFAAHEWFVLLREARARGLVGMLAAAAHDGALKLSTAQFEELALVERETAARTLLTEQRVLRLSAVLTAAEAPHRVLGGPSRARLGYRDLALRHDTSATVLTGPAGVRLVEQLAPAPGPSAGPIRVAAATALRRADITVDLHQLADPPAMLLLADQAVPTASVEEHLVLACLDLRSPEAVLAPEPAVPAVPAARAPAGRAPGSKPAWPKPKPAPTVAPAATTVATSGSVPVSLATSSSAATAGPAFDPTGDPTGDAHGLLTQRDVAELALSPAVDATRVRQVAERWKVTDEVTRALVDTWRRFELADRTPLSVWAERREGPVRASRAAAPRRRRRRSWSRLFARRVR